VTRSTGIKVLQQEGQAKLSPGTVFRAENNHKELKPETIEKLAAALGVSPTDLLAE
jgi:transcriptional regulator with XRE-family HTH domain